MTDPTQLWLESARRSLAAAEILHAAEQWVETCFNTQQAVEIALKAAIAHRNVAPPRLHSLRELLALQEAPVRDALAHLLDDLRALDTYYLETRYPDAMMGRLPGQQEADTALATARVAVGILERLLD